MYINIRTCTYIERACNVRPMCASSFVCEGRSMGVCHETPDVVTLHKHTKHTHTHTHSLTQPHTHTNTLTRTHTYTHTHTRLSSLSSPTHQQPTNEGSRVISDESSPTAVTVTGTVTVTVTDEKTHTHTHPFPNTHTHTHPPTLTPTPHPHTNNTLSPHPSYAPAAHQRRFACDIRKVISYCSDSDCDCDRTHPHTLTHTQSHTTFSFLSPHTHHQPTNGGLFVTSD